MHDTLRYLGRDPVHRRYHQGELSFSMVYAYSERFILPLSHDEVVHMKGSLLNKMPGDPWQKFANLRLLFSYMFGHPGKKLLFMGSELAQWAEWNYAQSLDWHLLDLPGEEGKRHRGVQQLISDLNALYAARKSLHQLDFAPDGFEWIDFSDESNSVIAFIRRSRRPVDLLIVVCNFTPSIREQYRIGVPKAGRYAEVLNTDAAQYGGSGKGNPEPVQARKRPWHGRDYSIELTLPPLAALLLQPVPRQSARLQQQPAPNIDRGGGR